MQSDTNDIISHSAHPHPSPIWKWKQEQFASHQCMNSVMIRYSKRGNKISFKKEKENKKKQGHYSCTETDVNSLTSSSALLHRVVVVSKLVCCWFTGVKCSANVATKHSDNQSPNQSTFIWITSFMKKTRWAWQKMKRWKKTKSIQLDWKKQTANFFPTHRLKRCCPLVADYGRAPLVKSPRFEIDAFLGSFAEGKHALLRVWVSEQASARAALADRSVMWRSFLCAPLRSCCGDKLQPVPGRGSMWPACDGLFLFFFYPPLSSWRVQQLWLPRACVLYLHSWWRGRGEGGRRGRGWRFHSCRVCFSLKYIGWIPAPRRWSSRCVNTWPGLHLKLHFRPSWSLYSWSKATLSLTAAKTLWIKMNQSTFHLSRRTHIFSLI